MVILGGGGAALAAAFLAFAFLAGAAYEGYATKQCLSAHERAEKALAAPRDYWGDKLRADAAEEAKKCTDLAARKQVEAGAAR